MVLADSKDFSLSWKMKRAFSLIEPIVKKYLDGFDNKTLHKINFTFKKQRYSCFADAIFVIK